MNINPLFRVTVAPPVFSSAAKCPEYTPEEVAATFNEASLGYAAGLYDASGAMYRKVLDLATRGRVGVEPQSVARDHTDYISWKVAKDLRLRLDWLFERGKLPHDLKELASCVHQDGNDAAHASETIGQAGALDLQDFTIAILEMT